MSPYELLPPKLPNTFSFNSVNFFRAKLLVVELPSQFLNGFIFSWSQKPGLWDASDKFRQVFSQTLPGKWSTCVRIEWEGIGNCYQKASSASPEAGRDFHHSSALLGGQLKPQIYHMRSCQSQIVINLFTVL